MFTTSRCFLTALFVLTKVYEELPYEQMQKQAPKENGTPAPPVPPKTETKAKPKGIKKTTYC